MAVTETTVSPKGVLLYGPKLDDGLRASAFADVP